MSRSYKHTPITGYTTAESEKEDKKLWHGALRTAEREFLSKIDVDTTDDDNLIDPVEKDVSNVWSFDKDGKHYMNINNDNIKLMRK